jgi:hypothetical protein
MYLMNYLFLFITCFSRVFLRLAGSATYLTAYISGTVSRVSCSGISGLEYTYELPTTPVPKTQLNEMSRIAGIIAASYSGSHRFRSIRLRRPKLSLSFIMASHR